MEEIINGLRVKFDKVDNRITISTDNIEDLSKIDAFNLEKLRYDLSQYLDIDDGVNIYFDNENNKESNVVVYKLAKLDVTAKKKKRKFPLFSLITDELRVYKVIDERGSNLVIANVVNNVIEELLPSEFKDFRLLEGQE